VNHGPGVGQKLVAVDKRTGGVAWEAQPPKVDPSEQRMAGPKMAGPAVVVSFPFVQQGDKDDDAALSRAEMTGLAEKWFDKLDPQKAGKVTKAELVERLGGVVPPPPGAPDPNFNTGRMIGPGLFAATDADKDGAVTREEFKSTFGGWFDKWGGGKGEPIDANQVLDGLNAIFPPPPGASFGGASGPGGSWSTPVLIRTDTREELIVPFPNRVASYDPKTGKLLWFSRDMKDSTSVMPVYADGLVIAHSGDMAGGSTVAVRPGGSGDVTESHRAWKQPRVKGSIGSGIATGGRLYSIATEGFVLCTDLKTGKQLWQKRLEGTGDKNNSWSSMVLADGRIYVPNQSGEVFVVGAGPKFELLASNSVNEPTNATLAASDGELFLRTDKSLWCISAAGGAAAGPRAAAPVQPAPAR
jgi:outer membrane protein assembly factor BamB